ncbi:MAG TPA: DNA-processing protein DprA [Burkholderiales bacterium]|jgi:DNA processing protein|nr:DNA-processing protein DprA [Burkholderiales bacterium]
MAQETDNHDDQSDDHSDATDNGADELAGEHAQAAHWLRLTSIPGLGDQAIRKLLTAFGLPGRIFGASRGELLRVVGESQVALLVGAKGDSAVEAAVEKGLQWLALPGNHLLTLADADYPPDLLNVADPPPVLYLKGRRELLNAPCFAVVGSRNATAQGIANAESFSRVLSESGYTIVSGQALGIDTAAHRGGLAGRGSTIAVIGTGADIVYPARNRELAHEIAARGLLVTEFALGTPAISNNFPRRNRIISGLARGVLVVEAALRSGSLITARLAGEQGRDVFAIPGSIHSPLSKGCHSLIKQGAKLVDDARDIIEELGPVPAAHAADPVQQEAGAAAHGAPLPAAQAPFLAAHAALLEHLGYDPVTLDQLAERSGLTIAELSAILLQLELDGAIAQLPGGKVQRIGGRG